MVACHVCFSYSLSNHVGGIVPWTLGTYNMFILSACSVLHAFIADPLIEWNSRARQDRDEYRVQVARVRT